METIDTPEFVVRKVRRALHFAPQTNQLMSERGILSLKPGVRLEWRGQDGQVKHNSSIIPPA
jgi:hypothetical protein